MIEFYPQIKYVHILLAMLSGTLFAVRGGFALAGDTWSQGAGMADVWVIRVAPQAPAGFAYWLLSSM